MPNGKIIILIKSNPITSLVAFTGGQFLSLRFMIVLLLENSYTWLKTVPFALLMKTSN